MTSAHVRETLWGFLKWSRALQRGQAASACCFGRRHRSPQAWHAARPREAAEISRLCRLAIGMIALRAADQIDPCPEVAHAERRIDRCKQDDQPGKGPQRNAGNDR